MPIAYLICLIFWPVLAVTGFVNKDLDLMVKALYGALLQSIAVEIRLLRKAGGNG